jgi:hypothetical protein
MSDRLTGDPPSSFVVQWATELASRVPQPRRALDVAMGRGRHALVLAALGFRTFGVDINFEAVRSAKRAAANGGLELLAWCADLTISPLPPRRFELIVVTRYLQRDLTAALSDALVSNGVVIYETFTVNQRRLGVGPTSPDHLLEPDELKTCFPELEILFHQEVHAPEAVARLVARKSS